MASKNNPTTKKEKLPGKYVTSTNCENCKTKCEKGENYLKIFSIRHEGNGVWCSK
jgi:hypothetical protein